LKPNDRADGYLFGDLNIVPTDNALDPMGSSGTVTSATVFVQNNGQPLTIACAPSGMLSHDPAGTTTLDLEPFRSVACPGEPVPDASFDFSTALLE
jgi:hypothetical protein